MRRIIIPLAALVVAVLVAGTAYLWAEQRGKHELSAAIAQLRTSIGPGGALTYQSARAAPLFRSATLTGVAARDSQGDRLTASTVSLTAHGPILTHLSARDVGIAPHGGPGIITVRSLEAWGIAMPSGAGNAPPAPPHPSRFTADEVSVTLSTGHLSIAHLAGSGLDLGTASQASAAPFLPGMAGLGRSRIEFDRIFFAGPNLFTLDVERLGVTRDATADRVLGTATLTGIHAVDPAYPPGLQAIGLDDIRADLSEHIQIVRRGGVIDLAPGRLDLSGLGTLGFGLDLDEADILRPGAMSKPADVVRVLQNARLVRVRLAWRDAGLLDRALAVAARRRDTTTQGVRAEAAESITADPRISLLPDADEARTALASFITHGGTLVVDLHPRDPLSFATLLAAAHDPALAAATLGLSVEKHPSTSSTAH